MNTPKFPVEFFFTVYGEPLNVSHEWHNLVAGAVFTGKVRVYVGWRDVNGVPDDRADALLSPADLGLLLGDGPPRPAEDVRAMNSQGVIIGGFSWDIDTREYADGPHTLTVGDATWVRHYPDTVAGLAAGGKTISLSVVVANGGTDSGSER